MSSVITQGQAEPDIAAARQVLSEYMAWTLTVEGDAHDAPTFRGHREELADLPGVYVPPAGRLFWRERPAARRAASL